MPASSAGRCRGVVVSYVQYPMRSGAPQGVRGTPATSAPVCAAAAPGSRSMPMSVSPTLALRKKPSSDVRTSRSG